MSRIDRRTALRRAAAPSVDLSLMPDAGAVHALLEAANRGRGPAPERSRATPPTAFDKAPKASPVATETAPEDAPVPRRFRMRPRPTGHPTLQPLDAPVAAALLRAVEDPSSDEHELEAALAFVRAHAPKERSDRYERAPQRVSQPPSTHNVPADAPAPRMSEMPTLIHFGRATTVDLTQPAPVPASESKRNTRKASSTLKPPRSAPALTLTPNAEEKRFWDTSEDHVEPPDLLDDIDETLGGEVDPELDAWMAKRGRGRVLTALGVAATMLLLVAAAAGGIAVMAQPTLLQGAQPAETTAPAPPPPPRPLRPVK